MEARLFQGDWAIVVEQEKWSQMQRIELVGDNEFVDTIIKGLK
jgi:hypothetical protein